MRFGLVRQVTLNILQLYIRLSFVLDIKKIENPKNIRKKMTFWGILEKYHLFIDALTVFHDKFLRKATNFGMPA